MPAFLNQPVSSACCDPPCDRNTPCEACCECVCCPLPGEYVLPRVKLSLNGGLVVQYYYNLVFDLSKPSGFQLCRWLHDSGTYDIEIAWDSVYSMKWFCVSSYVSGDMYHIGPEYQCNDSMDGLLLKENGTSADNHVLIEFNP